MAKTNNEKSIYKNNKNDIFNTALYIVYGYNSSNPEHTNYIYGIYHTIQEAHQRIVSLCGENSFKCSWGTYYSNACEDVYKQNTYFINKLNMGAQQTELFTDKVFIV